MGHIALADLNSPQTQLLMNFGDRAMLTVAQGSHQRDNFQAEFGLGQGPNPFFFGVIGDMIPLTSLVLATPDHDCSSAEPSQRTHCPSIVITYPHELSTTAALLSLDPEHTLSACLWSGLSSAHSTDSFVLLSSSF